MVSRYRERLTFDEKLKSLFEVFAVLLESRQHMLPRVEAEKIVSTYLLHVI